MEIHSHTFVGVLIAAHYPKMKIKLPYGFENRAKEEWLLPFEEDFTLLC